MKKLLTFLSAKGIYLLIGVCLLLGIASLYFRNATLDDDLYLFETSIMTEALSRGEWFGDYAVGTHGFLFKLPVALVFLLTGQSLAVATVWNVLLACFSLFLFYKVLKEIFPKSIYPFLGALLFFANFQSHFIWSSGYVGMRLKNKYNKPFFVTGHGYDVYKLPFKNDWWKNRISSILENADHILTVSEGNKRYLLRLGVKGSNISVVGNGYNSDLFFDIDKNKVREELNIPEDRKVLVSVGNLEEVKGHRYLIEAVKILKEEYPNILCYIVGGGSLNSEYEDLIKEYGLEENVFLVGYVKHGEVNKWMNAADLFVLPSLQESFGIVQLEALACGIPVIATKTNGSKEVIRSDDYGLLCNIKDALDLAEKVVSGLQKEWRKELMKEYAQGFSWEKVSEGIVNVYSEH